MGVIRHLPERLIGQIAAGEVVERPASVLKELVENSLDAGATEVRVELVAGGKRLVRVDDDGRGMDRDDALAAFDRHATSKIASFEDLERIGTLGFRGEALASIASVARVDLVTATEPGDGHRVRIDGGRVRSAEPAARARGTTISVASLFWNVPARRKFLKTTATELRRALEVIEGYALARPDVRFSVEQEGRKLLEALPAGEGAAGARARIGQIFGPALASALVDMPADDRGEERIWGFVGNPSTTRRRRIFCFVNRRLIRDRAVLATFYRAVRESWRSDEFPALFLFLDLAPEEVDVNVHPQKSEVRFRDGRLLGRLGARLRESLGDALGEVEAPLGAPTGAPPPPSWRGLGERWPEREGRAGWSEEWRGAGAVGETRLAAAGYAPFERPVVPLSGRRGPSSLRLLGQYKGTLILLEGPEGLFLIDQHVAHERILYERLRLDLAAESTPSQRLLEPRVLELSAGEAARLADAAAGLERFGFELARLSGDTLGLTAVPAALSASEAEAVLVELARSPSDDPEEAETVGQGLLDALAASYACRAAVKMHEPLAAAEMEALVGELFEAEQPYACPHGRPIVLELSDRDLEKRFKRR